MMYPHTFKTDVEPKPKSWQSNLLYPRENNFFQSAGLQYLADFDSPSRNAPSPPQPPKLSIRIALYRRAMDCTSGDARLVSSPLFAQLPSEVQGIISGKIRSDTQTYLSTLSALAIEPSLASLILTCYEPLFPELVSRWPSFASLDSIAGAFSRILPLEPHLVAFAQEALGPDSKPSFLEPIYLSNDSTPDELESLPAEKTREILLALYRLLMFRKEAFMGLVEPLHLFPLLVHPNRAIRYLVIKIISIYMNAGDFQEQEMVSNYLGEDAALGIYEGRTVDYGFLVCVAHCPCSMA